MFKHTDFLSYNFILVYFHHNNVDSRIILLAVSLYKSQVFNLIATIFIIHILMKIINLNIQITRSRKSCNTLRILNYNFI